jgi:hypothetical protein
MIMGIQLPPVRLGIGRAAVAAYPGYGEDLDYIGGNSTATSGMRRRLKPCENLRRNRRAMAARRACPAPRLFGATPRSAPT